MGRSALAFAVALVTFLVISRVAPNGAWRTASEIAWIAAGIWLLIQVFRQNVWRLRNRLLVTYLFIAVVPIMLILGLTALGGYLLVGQTAVYLVTSELNRRIDGLAAATDSMAQVVSPASLIQFGTTYPGIEVVVRDSGHEFRYPKDATLPDPREGWQTTRGVIERSGRFYLWSYERTSRGDIAVTAPLTREYLAGLAPDLGPVVEQGEAESHPQVARLPERANTLDTDVIWLASVPAADWEHPGPASKQLSIAVWTRVSAVLSTLFRRSDQFQGLLQALLLTGIGVFAVVEVVSLTAGVRMTRTITGAIHNLYDGTQRVMKGDFSHRIEVTGRDQLAELTGSFNQMTQHLEHLVSVAKEKERLQSEMEIAREVQNQLYPRSKPDSKHLRVTATCKAARIVSGDYYDYAEVGDGRIAVAVGDVAGKSISAAMLMATIQSCTRTQWKDPQVTPAELATRLNRHLHANTSHEKFATLCLGFFDEANSCFTYSNAGHTPPVLVREGAVQRLDVNGMVVGAFENQTYTESCLTLQSSDLLVFFTDGVTESDNEFGEMFGDQRLIDLVLRCAHRPEEEIVAAILDAVHKWTGSEEAQDDITLLLARRV